MATKKTTEELLVIADQKTVGKLWLDAQRTLNFQYDPQWLLDPEAYPISMSLPLQKASFLKDTARAYFANLLPEENIRRIVASRFGLSEGNDFGLLQAIGGDCAGALSLVSEKSQQTTPSAYEKLLPDELEDLLHQLPDKPLLAGEDGFRLSLAGAQNKVPLYFDGHWFFLPKGQLPSSHILKPAISRFTDTIQNEAFCMQLAKQLGLEVPSVRIWKGKNLSAYVVTRYDREITTSSTLRIHQEDFCQALGILPHHKYQAEGGPGFKECFKVANKFQLPANDKHALITWAIYNVLIGNMDAHGKNISLLISKDGFSLAPFYDLMCTTVYPTLTKKLAMKVGTAYDSNGISKKHWGEFAQAADVKDKIVFDECSRLSRGISQEALKLRNEFQSEHGASLILDDVVKKIQRTSESMQTWL